MDYLKNFKFNKLSTKKYLSKETNEYVYAVNATVNNHSVSLEYKGKTEEEADAGFCVNFFFDVEDILNKDGAYVRSRNAKKL